MSDELTIEECDKSIELYVNKLEFIEYLLKSSKHNKKDLENNNYIYEIDIKLLKFMQKQGFKLDIDFDEYNNEVQKHISKNKNVIKTEINIGIEKRNIEIENIKKKIMELSQVSGFLIGAVSKPIRDDK